MTPSLNLSGLALTGALCFLATTAVLALRPGHLRGGWRLPALAAALFGAYSMFAVLHEGPTGFWPEHTRNLWGVQIWFDLLFAAAVAWALLLPRARRVGMHPLPWLALVAVTGSIGLGACTARLLYLEERQRADNQARR